MRKTIREEDNVRPLSAAVPSLHREQRSRTGCSASGHCGSPCPAFRLGSVLQNIHVWIQLITCGAGVVLKGEGLAGWTEGVGG